MEIKKCYKCQYFHWIRKNKFLGNLGYCDYIKLGFKEKPCKKDL